MKPAFTGGSLSFKGDKEKKNTKKKKSKSKHKIESSHSSLQPPDRDVPIAPNGVDFDDTLTDAERKSQKRKRERERLELEKLAQKSHRQRIEEMNEKLSTQTEHNDIPRISAAGNG